MPAFVGDFPRIVASIVPVSRAVQAVAVVVVVLVAAVSCSVNRECCFRSLAAGMTFARCPVDSVASVLCCPVACSLPFSRSDTVVGTAAVAGKFGPVSKHMPIESSCSAGIPVAIAETDSVASAKVYCVVAAALGT